MQVDTGVLQIILQCNGEAIVKLSHWLPIHENVILLEILTSARDRIQLHDPAALSSGTDSLVPNRWTPGKEKKNPVPCQESNSGR
jgi:hypothetical protein